MSDAISVDVLVPGDVLLYKGTSLISRAIQFFDGTDFSHAALCLGDGVVGEAVSEGLVRRPYPVGASGTWVQAHRLKDDVPLQPVVEVANAYLDQGNRYGYEQLLLLAMLCLTRKLRFAPTVRQLVRRVLDDAAALLTRLISQNREPTICSEFVYRAYDEALPAPNDVYTLWIATPRIPGAPSFGAAGPSPARGQGIHPQSLLALYASSAGGAWTEPREPGVGFGAPALAGGEPDARDLDDLIGSYLEETQAGPGAVPPSFAGPPAGLDDLLNAAQRFAVAFHAATYRGEVTFGAPVPTATLSRALSLAAADFVTPGDLYKTQSLFPLGRIEA